MHNSTDYTTPQMTHAAHPVTSETPPGYDGNTTWLKYSDAVEKWCDFTKVKARRRGPATAARPSGQAELFKERLGCDSLNDPETGVEYYLATMRPFCCEGQPNRFFVQVLSDAEMYPRGDRLPEMVDQI